MLKMGAWENVTVGERLLYRLEDDGEDDQAERVAHAPMAKG